MQRFNFIAPIIHIIAEFLQLLKKRGLRASLDQLYGFLILSVMPTYEYECKSCAHTFEVFQSMSDQPLKECPECGSEIRRLIFGGTGVIFKGSGFYVTDKGKSGNSESKSTKADTSNKSGKSEKTTDASQVSNPGAKTSSPCSDCPNKGVSAGSSEKCTA